MIQIPGVPAILGGSLVFVAGAILGSFLNVVALRWRADRGLRLTGRSHCPSCRKRLRWFELVPVVSYLLQAGRCRRCQAPLPIRYLLVELGFGLVVLLLFGTYGVALHSFFLLLLSCFLLLALLIDVDQLLLPDELTVAVLLLTLLSLIFVDPNLSHLGSWGWWNQPLAGALLGLVTIGGLYLGTGGRGMGLGDVKLGPVLGLGLGGVGTLVALSAAFLLGAVVGLALIALGRAGLKSAVPFGPFLITGWWIALLWGPQLVTWYTSFL